MSLCRYPPWLAENASSLPEDELRRYEQQHLYVCEVCTLFEEEEEANNSGLHKAKIMEVMQLMQECGQPPRDLVRCAHCLCALSDPTVGVCVKSACVRGGGGSDGSVGVILWLCLFLWCGVMLSFTRTTIVCVCTAGGVSRAGNGF